MYRLSVSLLATGAIMALLTACGPRPGAAPPTAIAPPASVLPAVTPPAHEPAPTTAPAPATPGPEPAAPGDGAYQVLFRIPKGADGVTYRGEGIGEMQIVGPTALAIGPDGSFWVLDTMAQRVLRYSPAGERLATLTLNDEQRALSDLAVTATDVYILDGLPTPPEVLRLTYDGQVAARYPLPPGYSLNDGVTGLGLDAEGAPLLELFLRSRWARLLDAGGAVRRRPATGGHELCGWPTLCPLCRARWPADHRPAAVLRRRRGKTRD